MNAREEAGPPERERDKKEYGKEKQHHTL